MFGLYYRIWVDAIVSERSKKIEKRNWKLFSLISISLLQGINLFTFFYWMKAAVNRNLPLFMPVGIFNAKPLNGFISVVITFVIPFVILNYLVIFSNNQYERLMDEYPNQNGRLYRKYVLYSTGLFIVPIIIKKLFF